MKISIPFILLLSICSNGFCQNNALDSLETRINQYQDSPDTTYINLRNDFIRLKIFEVPADTTLLEYTILTLEIAQDMNYPKGEIFTYQKLGNIYQYHLGKPIESIDFYQKALDIVNANPEFRDYQSSIKINIGNIYYNQQEFHKALEIYKDLHANFKDEKSIITQYIGNVYGSLLEFDSAVYYFELAVHDAEEVGNHLVEAYTQSALSFNLSKLSRSEEAIKNAKESLFLIDKHNLEYIRVPVYTNTAMVYLESQDYVKAEDFANRALILNKPSNNLFIEKSIYATLFDVYEGKKEYKNALEVYKKYIVLNDSITNDDRKLEVSRKEIEYEAGKKEVIAKAELERQEVVKNNIVLGSGGLLIFSVMGFLLYRQKQLAVAKTKEAAFKVGIAESKLVGLRTQLNPHFIFNALNSIDHYMQEHGGEKASLYLTNFSKLMRTILENSEKDWITLDEELKLMSVYIEIEALRLNHNLTYEIKLDELLDAENILVPSMLLQPFIENSIVHGIGKKETDGHILLSISKDKGQLVCVIDDDGIGRMDKGPSSGDSRKSMGMPISKSRIDYLNQITEGKSEISIEDKEQGVCVTIKIPFKEEF